MINSILTIGGHLTKRILCNDEGASIVLPPFYPGEYQFRLKLVATGDDGEDHVVYPNVTSLSASIGLVYAEPRAGSFKLRYHRPGYPPGDPTDSILFNEDAEDFRTKLAALAESGSGTNALAEVYQPTPSTWLCRFDTDLVPVWLEEAPGNDLEPETFVRVREFAQSGENWAEVRLIQGPVASTSFYEPVLPEPPTVERIRGGYTAFDDGGLTEVRVNEIQAIRVPPGFQGTYVISFQGRQTAPLSANDGVQVIEDALNGLYYDNPPIQRFVVTNPETDRAYVEFVGPFAGTPMELLLINVSSLGRFDQLFTLNLNTAEVAESLRLNASVQMTMEITLHISDPNVLEDPGQDITLFQAPVTILRPLHYEGLVAAAPINWLLPPNPRDYIPFDPNQVFTGNQTYRASFGDGLANTFVFDHMLASDVLTVEVRENATPGIRIPDDQYIIEFTTDDSLTIQFPSAPADNSKIIFIIGPSTSQFRDHHHSIPQVDGLVALINELLIRIGALEAFIPVIPIAPPTGSDPFGGQGAADILQVTIPDLWNVAPTNRPPSKENPGNDVSKLPTTGLMLPAVHDSIELGEFTADPDDDSISVPDNTAPLVAGQRVRIYPGVFSEIGTCAFDAETNFVTAVLPTEHGLVAGRKVKFTGGVLPTSIVPSFVYYVINETAETYQISSTKNGPMLPLTGATTSGEFPGTHYHWSVAEPPGGLEEAVDYFVVDPTGGGTSATDTFKLASTLAGATTAPFDVIDITDPGFPPLAMSAIEDAPAVIPVTNRLPPPLLYKGNAYSVRETIQLNGGRGIRATVVHPEDIIASDGRMWYPVTRSDSPGSNSFYPLRMEQEIFRLAINDRMLAASSVFTLTWDMTIRMFKHTTNVQYLMVCEWADLPATLVPAPTGPNLYAVVWNKVPIMSQKLIITEIPITNHFGIQVVRLNTGVLKTNKKAYNVKAAGDSIPNTANFALRCRLIEFDTEDNVKDAVGLVYYSLTKGIGQVTLSTPTLPPETLL
jgi:hypothetical protein